MGEGRKAACSHPALPRRVASPNYVSLPGKPGWVKHPPGLSLRSSVYSAPPRFPLLLLSIAYIAFKHCADCVQSFRF